MGRPLGQHFLRNKAKLRKVADVLEVKEGDIVIEVGPGHGELTRYLLDAGARVVALERDTELVGPLRETFAGRRFEVVEGNALETLPQVVDRIGHEGASQYKIAGNIPYYITGFLLRVIEELERRPAMVVMTIQKEVAERICARPPKMNLLAASVQIWADPKIVSIVPRKDFSPPPKVDSATIVLRVKEGKAGSGAYYRFIKRLFAHPRKTIANNIAGKDGSKDAVSERLRALGFDPGLRPHDLDVAAMERMAAEMDMSADADER